MCQGFIGVSNCSVWTPVLAITSPCSAHSHPSLPDSASYLPLHYACDGEHVECVRAILSIQGILGLSGLRLALSLANDRGNTDIIALLQEAMVRWVWPDRCGLPNVKLYCPL